MAKLVGLTNHVAPGRNPSTGNLVQTQEIEQRPSFEGSFNNLKQSSHIWDPKVGVFQVGKDDSTPIQYHQQQDLSSDQIAISTSGRTTKSVQEARKQAQNAVLNLLPLKVRFQNFVEEGIDENVIRTIFDDIGMTQSQAPTKPQSQCSDQSQGATRLKSPTAPTGVLVPAQPDATQIHLRGTTKINGNNQQVPALKSFTDSASLKLNKGEERKDRIARLLEEKSKKLLKSSQPPATQRSISPSSAALPDVVQHAKSMPIPQPARKIDKDKILRQKMEALQKSREARALKSTTKPAVAPPVALPVNGVVQQQEQQPQLDIAASSVSQPFEPQTQSAFSQQQMPQQTIMPSIPGLFLAGQTGPAQFSMSQNMPVNHRKRPVASDFDSSALTTATYKRPFGHSRNDQPLVIDVSDEESDEDGAEMELDDPVTDNFGRNNQAFNPIKPSIRDLPPLSDFPPKKTFTPASTLSTPPIVQNSSRSSAHPEVLKRKELEIEEMRRKIAEAEQRKKAKQIASGSQTPIRKTSTPIEAKTVKDSSIAEKVETSVQIERLMNDASRKIEEDQQKLAEAQVLEEQKAEDLKMTQAQQRRQRRAEIAANLPAVDAEVQESQKKLEDLRAETRKLELAVQQRLEDKRRLAEEMEKLGQEVDDQLQAQKDELEELNADLATDNEGMSFLYFFATACLMTTTIVLLFSPVIDEVLLAYSIVNARATAESVDVSSLTSTSEVETPIMSQPDVAMSDSEPSPGSSTDDLATTLAPSEDLTAVVQNASSKEVEQLAGQSQPPASPVHELTAPELAPDQVLSVTLQDSSASGDAENNAIDMGDISMTDVSAAEESGPSTNQLQTPPIDIADNSDTSSSKDMDESMSDSESAASAEMDIEETYVPGAGSHVQEGSGQLPTSLPVEPESLDASDNESDIYEPPEATPPSTNEPVTADSPSFSPVPPASSPGGPGTDQEMSISPSISALPEPPTSVESPALPKSIAEVAIHPHIPSPAALTSSQSETSRAAEKATFFTPYDSPLKRFHAYRFHPDFTKEVPGGYKSVTYSHNIDASKELCRFELAGGVCNDKSCEFQHFRDIGLPGAWVGVSRPTIPPSPF